VLRVEANGAVTPLVTGLVDPRWVAVAEDGALFISVRRLTRATDPPPSDDDEADDDAEPQMVLRWQPGALRIFADGLRRAEGVAVRDNTLYVATRGRRSEPPAKGVVYRLPILAGGVPGPMSALAPSDRYASPTGLAADRLGALWLTTPKLENNGWTTEDSIAKVSPAGVVTRFASRLANPQGLAFDAAGNLFVADGQRGRILRFRAPSAPAINTLPGFTAQSSLTLTGTAEPSARLDAFVNEAETSTAGIVGTGGAFSISVPLDTNQANEIEIFATGQGGAGLTSSAATATLVHDNLRPTIDFTAPAAAAYIRGQVDVTIQAADTGSDVRAVTLTAAGRGLTPTLTPALPAPLASGVAAWDTTATDDGAQPIIATATDGAANVGTVTRTVIVDNTAPDTEIVSGPTDDITQTEAVFTFSGTDALTPSLRLTFAWRLDGGAWSTFSAATSATVTGLGQGAHTFEVKARDLAGNEDATPAARSFGVGGPTVTVAITVPAAGATVPGGSLLVRGVVTPGGGDVGVSVDGVVAGMQGQTFVALVPLTPATTAITATATTIGGATASQTIPISVPGAGTPAVSLHASPPRGVAPLEVRFQVQSSIAATRIDLDADGDGSVDAVIQATDESTFTFTTPGLYVATATVIDSAGNPLVAQTIVEVLDQVAFDSLLQARWTGLKDALRASNVPAALQHIVGRARARYEAIFRALPADLPDVDTILTDVTLVEVAGAEAIYEMVRTDNGVVKSFEIRFLLEQDGVWRLWSF
jgi:hypothetical protein